MKHRQFYSKKKGFLLIEKAFVIDFFDLII